ncbi:hypothetical protein CCM_04037 [Cordyceps militaris CM01]|uniref:Uncharacterized protein n=1 Tax=Cordyceps militaris (strain CM01) TaxID=983644 RepID=G3JDI9_CORMM|nr:uncharacterized protein CCM_04037 [Cordyceps militaris CM01]EGX92664.1 hypothetical protein CCM_04037 [Cordyceps militaris CM01]
MAGGVSMVKGCETKAVTVRGFEDKFHVVGGHVHVGQILQLNPKRRRRKTPFPTGGMSKTTQLRSLPFPMGSSEEKMEENEEKNEDINRMRLISAAEKKKDEQKTSNC